MTASVKTDVMAPDFQLDDFQGRTLRLSEFRHQRNVVLVFNRGFM